MYFYRRFKYPPAIEPNFSSSILISYKLSNLWTRARGLELDLSALLDLGHGDPRWRGSRGVLPLFLRLLAIQVQIDGILDCAGRSVGDLVDFAGRKHVADPAGPRLQ